MSKGISSQPRQKLPYSKKTRKWRKENIDYADNFSLYHNEGVRKSIKNKIINLNLYNGILDMDDLNSIVNPYQIDASFIPDKIPHHPIIVPKIDLLIGEESMRHFEYNVVVTNQNAISSKEYNKKQELKSQLISFLQSNYKDEELKEKLNEIKKYIKYDWQDIRERMGGQILKHYSKEQNFKSIFTECFKDSLIHGEELVQIENVHGEPIMTKLNPMKVHTVQTGNSSKLEDAQIIIIEDHWSIGKIIDYFYEELKPKDIEYLMKYTDHKSSNTDTPYKDSRNLLQEALDHQGKPFIDDVMNIAEINGHFFSNDLTDEDGNIRVFRVYWKSLKKVKKVKYYDKFGEVNYKFRSEEYKPDKTMGEEAKTMWINEMWEGTKIGKDVYLSMKPKDVQYTKISNPSYCHAGIIGQVYNTDQSKAVSLIDRMKNYQYLYDVMWDRLNKAISTNYGKIFELDLAKVPEGWEVDKWLHFAVVNKIAVVDSFKEGNKGASTGKLAGGMNTQGGRSIDMETGNYIQQHIQMLEYIKLEMNEISGITKQRQGEISSRETVGGVERSVMQSATITEHWFNIHEDFKIRALTAFLETAKIALKGNNKKVQYILDDLSIQLLNIDGEVLSEADYGIVVTDSNKVNSLKQAIRQLSQSLIQDGTGLSTLIDIYMSDSISDMRNRIEQSEEETIKRQQSEQQQANKLEQDKLNKEHQIELAKIKQDERDSIRKADTDKYIAELKVFNEYRDADGNDEDDDGISDPLEEEKLELERIKERNSRLEKIKEMHNDMKKHNDEMKIKEKEIKQKKKETNSK